MATERVALVCAVALASVACDHGTVPSRGGSEPAAVASHDAVRSVETASGACAGSTPLDAMPWDERMALERALAVGDVAYAPRIGESGPMLETPGSVVATFTSGGAHISLAGHTTTLQVVALGREGALRPFGTGAGPSVAGPEVRTARSLGVVEWWRSLPSGLEHGVTIAGRPAGGGELTVEIAVTGALSAHVFSDDAIELRDGRGTRVATYAHLVVVDASGVRIPARMSMDGDRIALVVDDAGARYPLVVDPIVTAEEATLLAPDGAAGDSLGHSVALSADGSLAIVGATFDTTPGGAYAGSARIFSRVGATWAQEASLRASDGAMDDHFGWAVALSADGSRAIVGVPNDDTVAGADAGSARVYLRTGVTWAQEATLLAPDGAAVDLFGHSVALSSDGGRALVGAYNDTVGGISAGSARVFLRTGTTWLQEATLSAPDGAAFDELGRSVALSADGSRALVGMSGDDTIAGMTAGSARVFLRTGTTWAQEATLLAPSGAPLDFLGFSVALSSDGSRAVVGAYLDDTAAGADAGSAHVFARVGTTWAAEAVMLAPDGAPNDHFGISVALSGDGSRAVVGAHYDDASGALVTGTARVLFRTGTTWFEEATLVASGGADFDELGRAVGLSSDGTRVLVGVPYDDNARGNDAGSARVFTILLGADGSTCSGDGVCVSGFCTDGVCCRTRCAGGASDCQACSVALTGGVSGTCAPLAAAVAPTIVCRPSSGICDPDPEICASTSTACPADVLSPPTTVCRIAAPGGCDVAETCTGTSGACPADAVAMSGTVCRMAALTGCDASEVCDGSTVNCPGDVFAAAGVVCRSVMGACDVQEVCAGGSPICPLDAVRDSSVVCRAAATPCDVAESCTGARADCPADLYAPATTLCGTAPSDVCDAADHCEGTTPACVPTYLSGVACRVASGVCDVAEVCSGSASACPPEGLLAAGVPCRVSSDTTCDPEETCDGVAAACPADVTSCTPMADGGSGLDGGRSTDDGGPRDGGVSPDATAPLDAPSAGVDAGGPVVTRGCACHAGRAPFHLPAPLVLAAALATRGCHRRARRRSWRRRPRDQAQR